MPASEQDAQATPPQRAIRSADDRDQASVEYAPIESLAQLRPHVPSLTSLLQSCVNPSPHSSSIGFRAPLSSADAAAYWYSLADKLVDEPGRPPTVYLFVVTELGRHGLFRQENGDCLPPPPVLATVQIHLVPKETHRHRAEVAKLLVTADARGRGLGRDLMKFIEEFARSTLKREMLTLDTATETGAREFYNRIGYTEWGTCPSYADFADGKRGDATFFVKFLK